MSKSSGEFLTVSLLEEKGYLPVAYRFFCLQSHYRKSLVFSWEGLDNAQGAYNKLIEKIATLKEGGDVDPDAFEQYKARFVEALDNDINTSLAVTAVYDVLKAPVSDATKLALLSDFDRVLSLDLIANAKAQRERDELARQSENGDPEILAAIAVRAKAKANKDYAEADRIRAELAAKGITLIDTPNGTTYKIG